MTEGDTTRDKQLKLLPGDDKHANLCALCRGSKLLCGKNRCPVILRFYSQVKVKPLISKTYLDGASPPSVFIGRLGYPKISIGPMIPPYTGDTSIIDTPELWLDKTIDEIVDFRSHLVRGRYIIDVTDVDAPDRIVEYTRDIALSERPVNAEALFERKPYGRVVFYDDIQPFGPSAPLKKLDINNPRYNHVLEKLYYDTDLPAYQAVVDAYIKGVNVSSIQRAFSVGAFGVKRRRRFVPTRWSITAVDNLLGLELLKKTKNYPLINEYRVYYHKQFDNRWVVLMMPSEWRYELIEAWYPHTTWNPYGKDVSIVNSYEFYDGRDTYAEIGGCYYAARLAVNELLNKERRQAGIVVMREAHPGYIMPIGVWNVRESVRKTLKGCYQSFSSLDEAFTHISTLLDIPIPRWVRNSGVLKDMLHQRRLDDYMRGV